MKKIRLKLLGFWPGFDFENSVFGQILSKHYEIEMSEDPEYLLCSFATAPFEYTRYDCVRIGISWDTFAPNFNQFDYFMCHDRIRFGDRYFWLPCFWDYPQYLFMAQEKHKTVPTDILARKEIFCDLIYRHGKDDYGHRKKAFDVLNAYKPVAAAGTFLNNMPDGKVVTHAIGGGKLELQQKSKFSLAIESISYPGYISEKVIHPLAAWSVPIYCGHVETAEILNPNAYINAADYDYDWERILQRVEQLDRNDDEYLSVLHQPAFVQEDYVDARYSQLEAFLVNIFSQPAEKAYRRLRDVPGKEYHYCPGMEEGWMKEYNALYTSHAPFHELYKRGLADWYVNAVRALLKKRRGG
ncbi:hypothetical protein B5E65_05690 [Gemmiger sp. An120]|uniref:glycosyltransferase family 10 domain-containing protein n=1 Tax=Gemmiger sp. An120 TaxID=1965549 RepID=UPI000B39F001|nr:glycosyltransferase family 10 [Gemmiger sp. An120]OUQ43263.1 hypothetical protein B5E65_05690 [Gemmiger sp. An120]